MSVYPKHDRALAIARSQLGIREHPSGSNTGAEVLVYQRATWLGGTGWPWCAALVCWVWQKAGFRLAYRGAGAYAWYDEGAAHVGRKIPREAWREVMPGDAVVWRIGAGHISLVVRIADGMVESIDGNVSDMVAVRRRPLSDVYGFVHIIENPIAPRPPAKPPTYEVVSSESGTKIVYYSGGSMQRVLARIKAILAKHPKGVTIRRRPS